MDSKGQPQPLRFKTGMVVSNWRLGGGDIELRIKGVNKEKREYLVQVQLSPEYKIGTQYWAYSDRIDRFHDSIEEVDAWKKELDLD